MFLRRNRAEILLNQRKIPLNLTAGPDSLHARATITIDLDLPEGICLHDIPIS